MAKNTFYFELEKRKYNETMVVNKEISFNHLVRETCSSDQIKVVDNHSTVSNIFFEKEVKLGYPIQLKKIKLQHQEDKDFWIPFIIPSKLFPDYTSLNVKKRNLSELKHELWEKNSLSNPHETFECVSFINYIKSLKKLQSENSLKEAQKITKAIEIEKEESKKIKNGKKLDDELKVGNLKFDKESKRIWHQSKNKPSYMKEPKWQIKRGVLLKKLENIYSDKKERKNDVVSKHEKNIEKEKSRIAAAEVYDDTKSSKISVVSLNNFHNKNGKKNSNKKQNKQKHSGKFESKPIVNEKSSNTNSYTKTHQPEHSKNNKTSSFNNKK